MKIVAFIPIKLNSERVPNKNLKCFSDGTPLAHLVFNTLSNVQEIDKIYCYCSDEKIKDFLIGRVEFLQRDKSLDTSETKVGDLIEAFLKDVSADIIVMSHVTSPFLKTETVKKCVNAVKSGKYDSAFTAAKVQEFLWQNGEPLNYNPAAVPRTQDLPIIYEETSGCFVFTSKMFFELNRRIGLNPYICEIGKIEATDIDYPEDFSLANAVYMNNLHHS